MVDLAANNWFITRNDELLDDFSGVPEFEKHPAGRSNHLKPHPSRVVELFVWCWVTTFLWRLLLVTTCYNTIKHDVTVHGQIGWLKSIQRLAHLLRNAFADPWIPTPEWLSMLNDG